MRSLHLILWRFLFAAISILVLLSASTSDRFYEGTRIRIIRDRNAENRVFGRLANSHQRGPFSDAGLTGLCHLPPESNHHLSTPRNNRVQCEVFYREGHCPRFRPYLSKPGGVGLVYYWLSAISPTPEFLRLGAAIGFSIVLTCWLLWTVAEFSWVVALLLLICLTPQQWLLRFGDNIGLNIGFMLLPMVVVSWLKWRGMTGWRLVLAVYVTSFLSFLINGAEFFLAVIVSTAVPVVYYAFRDRLGGYRTLVQVCRVGGASAAAALSAWAVLLLQIVSLPSKSLAWALMYTVSTVARRTYDIGGDFTTWKGVSTPLGEVLAQYFTIDAVQLSTLSVSFYHFFFILCLVTLVAYFWAQRRTTAALVVTTWVSLLGPLSWLILCKSHAAAHPFMDPLVWYIPFGLFALAAGCAVLVDVFSGWKKIFVG